MWRFTARLAHVATPTSAHPYLNCCIMSCKHKALKGDAPKSIRFVPVPQLQRLIPKEKDSEKLTNDESPELHYTAKSSWLFQPQSAWLPWLQTS